MQLTSVPGVQRRRTSFAPLGALVGAYLVLRISGNARVRRMISDSFLFPVLKDLLTVISRATDLTAVPQTASGACAVQDLRPLRLGAVKDRYSPYLSSTFFPESLIPLKLRNIP